MKLSRFKTRRTSYYFPETDRHSRFLFGVYHPYGSPLVKLYWALYTHSSLLRKLQTVEEKDFEFPYKTIMHLCPQGSLVSFNLGTPGEEQKISMLGYRPSTGDSFFAKYAVKEKAKELCRNEVKVLKELSGKGLAPEVLYEKYNGDSVFFMTSRVCGAAYDSFELNGKILEILISLAKMSYCEGKDNELSTALSHGDFCPWNMLRSGDSIHLIDWEMAKNRVLGYDMFIFLLHVRMVMGAKGAELTEIIEKNHNSICRYFKTFDIDDYLPYLKAFLGIRIKDEQKKGHAQMVEQYVLLQSTL